MEAITPDKTLPKLAYRYWPSGPFIKTGENKSTVRYIFYNVSYTEFETSKIQEFKDFIAKSAPSLTLPSFYNDSELLRIVLGCKFNMKRGLEALKSSIAWRSINLKESFFTLLPLCKDFLNSGTIYFHGRDHRFRPLIVINLEKFNFKRVAVDVYCNLLCFLLEYAIQKLMIPGQVENWIVITDLSNFGITELPVADLKRLIKVLQDNFRCRMIVNFVLNSPGTIFWVWNLVKRFIEEHTIKKIRIEKAGTTPQLFEFFNKSQIEEKYGGSAPNLTQFWPPTFPEGPLEVEGSSIQDCLTGRDTYLEYNPDPDPTHLHIPQKPSSNLNSIHSLNSSISSCMGPVDEMKIPKSLNQSSQSEVNHQENILIEVTSGSQYMMQESFSNQFQQIYSPEVLEIKINSSQRSSSNYISRQNSDSIDMSVSVESQHLATGKEIQVFESQRRFSGPIVEEKEGRRGCRFGVCCRKTCMII